MNRQDLIERINTVLEGMEPYVDVAMTCANWKTLHDAHVIAVMMTVSRPALNAGRRLHDELDVLFVNAPVNPLMAERQALCSLTVDRSLLLTTTMSLARVEAKIQGGWTLMSFADVGAPTFYADVHVAMISMREHLREHAPMARTYLPGLYGE